MPLLNKQEQKGCLRWAKGATINTAPAKIVGRLLEFHFEANLSCKLPPKNAVRGALQESH